MLRKFKWKFVKIGIFQGFSLNFSNSSNCELLPVLWDEDKIVAMELESGFDETEVQPRVQDRGRKVGDG